MMWFMICVGVCESLKADGSYRDTFRQKYQEEDVKLKHVTATLVMAQIGKVLWEAGKVAAEILDPTKISSLVAKLAEILVKPECRDDIKAEPPVFETNTETETETETQTQTK